MKPTADVLVIGSGAAGLTAALNLAETRTVAVIAKGALGECATGRAQGGIAAVLEAGDSFEAHINDTMIAGAGLNDRAVVEHVVEHAPAAIARLIELGVPFASENGALHLTREGGHSHRRIVHVADATGVTIVLTTHYLEEAEQLCDRIAIIHHGRVIANEPTRDLVAKAQETAVVVTFDRDIAEVPANSCFDNIALVDERTLESTYRKDRVNAGDVLHALTAEGLGIVDVSTRDPDLEDVFLSLVSEQEAA